MSSNQNGKHLKELEVGTRIRVGSTMLVWLIPIVRFLGDWLRSAPGHQKEYGRRYIWSGNQIQATNKDERTRYCTISAHLGWHVPSIKK
jgi:hypothetical protein